ncbi:MAG: hypothetical protein HYX67_02970 [Candidatus Melainabacteria bacterium]|nr:hypothetical protein [Candidatus Melainabacteria bacterium]
MQKRIPTKSVALALSLCCTGAVLAANVQTFELQTPAGPYHVEIRERSEGDERLLVQKNKKNLLDQTDHNFALIDPTSKEPNLGYTGSNLPLFDFDGNGTKDLIVRIWNGGAHCCYTYDIYSLANRASKIWHFSAGDGHMLTMPTNTGGLPIILIEDSTFRYWGAGVEVMPVVALRWQPDKIKVGAFKVDMDRMRSGKDKHPLPTEDQVKRSLKKKLTSDLTDYMLNLYYTGHGKEANKFLETVWPGNADIEKMGTASAFKHDFMKQLTTSPFFDAIESLNHGQVDFQAVK